MTTDINFQELENNENANTLEGYFGHAKKKKKYVSKYKNYISTYKESDIYKAPPVNLKELKREKEILNKRYGEINFDRLNMMFDEHHIPYSIS